MDNPLKAIELEGTIDENQQLHLDKALTGLRVSSVLRLHRLMTVTTSVIRRELGELPSTKWSEVESKLRELFGL